MKRTLVIMAKAPLIGKVKTRLANSLGSDQASELYRCFLLDTFALAERLRGISVTVAFTPSKARGILRNMVPGHFKLIPQVGANLNERLESAFAYHFALGYQQVAIIGSDSPTLPLSYLEQAFDLLTSYDVVLGPSDDGGYYLIGLRAPHPELLRGIALSTPTVLSETMKRAQEAELTVALLPPWYDIDTVEGLERLRAELEGHPDHPARHTRRFLFWDG